MYQSISINDPNFGAKLIADFKSNGVVVINDVFTNDECDAFMDGITTDFINLGTGIKLDTNTDIKNTWTTYNLPPQTRPGLFQSLMSNSKNIWTIRSHNNVRKIFETLYTDLRKKEMRDFIVSGDGINIRPGFVGPYATSKTKNDWAHVDQTIKNNIYKCIQGQAVLTNTTASFVASPKSHLVFDNILEKFNCTDTSNWLKFTDEQITTVKELIQKKGGQYQIPILSKKGSFIVWASTLVHSAKLQDKEEYPTNEDKYNGWRGVVYVCYRPKEEFTKAEISKRIKAFNENRVLNHWSTKMFGKKPGSRYLYLEKRHPVIETLINDPKATYIKMGTPILTDEQKKLIGL